MKKVLVLLLLVTVGFGVFAQEANGENQKAVENSQPKNVIAFDLGATLSNLFLSAVLNIGYDPAMVYGTAIHYERQLSDHWSILGRFSYRGMYLTEYDFNTKLNILTAEGHGRFYPSQDPFFVDLTLGYANYTLNASGTDMSPSHYIIIGGNLGWRIDFGRPGGMIMEPALGFYGAAGKNSVDFGNLSSGGRVSDLNRVYGDAVMWYLIGGPRFSLSFGYRF